MAKPGSSNNSMSTMKKVQNHNNLSDDEHNEELVKACIEAEKQLQASEDACDDCRWREWWQWRAANGATLLEALLLLEFAALERLHKG